MLVGWPEFDITGGGVNPTGPDWAACRYQPARRDPFAANWEWQDPDPCPPEYPEIAAEFYACGLAGTSQSAGNATLVFGESSIREPQFSNIDCERTATGAVGCHGGIGFGPTECWRNTVTASQSDDRWRDQVRLAEALQERWRDIYGRCEPLIKTDIFQTVHWDGAPQTPTVCRHEAYVVRMIPPMGTPSIADVAFDPGSESHPGYAYNEPSGTSRMCCRR